MKAATLSRLVILLSVLGTSAHADTFLSPGESTWIGNQRVTCADSGDDFGWYPETRQLCFLTSQISDLNNGTMFQIVTSGRGRIQYQNASLTNTVAKYRQLVQTGECVAPLHSTCDLGPYSVRGQGRGYAVLFDGQPLVADDSLQDTIKKLNFLKDNRMCGTAPRRECRIIGVPGNLALVIGSERTVLQRDDSRSDLEFSYNLLRSNGVCR